jgi:hypothetical protein
MTACSTTANGGRELWPGVLGERVIGDRHPITLRWIKV